MDRDALEKLSEDELVELVLRLQRPAKTSRASSKPPSTDKKEPRAQAKPGGAKPGHKGTCRKLHENPDETVCHRPDECPHCHGQLDASLPGDVIGEYDEIELPRLAVVCPHFAVRTLRHKPPRLPKARLSGRVCLA